MSEVITHSSESIDEILNTITAGNPALLLFFYGADVDYKAIEKKIRFKSIPFLGCMDAGRFEKNKYRLDEKSIVGMAISKDIIEKVVIDVVDMTKSRDEMKKESGEKLKNAAGKIGVDLANPDMERDCVINLLYGLNSATPFLEGQSGLSLMLQTVGGSSGGKTDFVETNVISSTGSGHLGAFALIKLSSKYKFVLDRISSFDEVEGKILTVSELAGPRHITGLNGKAATVAYCEAIGIDPSALKPETFASYTLGIDPGDGEKLITSIMTKDDKTGLLTYNDVLPGTQFKIFKAKKQEKDRTSGLSKIKNKSLAAFISFDCILCYLARNSLSEVDTIAKVYDQELPGIPKIGFGTFSENVCGANINQTETYLAIYKA